MAQPQLQNTDKDFIESPKSELFYVIASTSKRHDLAVVSGKCIMSSKIPQDSIYKVYVDKQNPDNAPDKVLKVKNKGTAFGEPGLYWAKILSEHGTIKVFSSIQYILFEYVLFLQNLIIKP